MAALPYMQFYVAEYLADTGHLTTMQHGAYLLLLMNYWQRGKALHALNGRLATVARMSNEEWNAVEDVLSEFFEVREDSWFHARVERDLSAVRAKCEQASSAGKASAQRRLNGRSTSVASGVSTERQPIDKNRRDKKRLKDEEPKGHEEEFSEAWNQNKGNILSAIIKLSKKRKDKVSARISEGLTLEQFTEAVKLASNTPFLTGKNDRGWKIDFDFLIENDTNLFKVLEGKYGEPAKKAIIYPSFDDPAWLEYRKAQLEAANAI